MSVDQSHSASSGQGTGHRFEFAAAAPSELAVVRRAAAAQLSMLGCPNVDSAVLVLSELASNALLHAGGAERIVVQYDESAVEVRVRDQVAQPPRPRTLLPDVGGHGMHIVQRLSREWGCTPCEQGKEVWAVVPLTPVADHGAGRHQLA